MCWMLMFVGPHAAADRPIGVVLLIVVALAGLVYELITWGNRRQVEADKERERVTEQIGLSEPIDFQSDMRPPREP